MNRDKVVKIARLSGCKNFVGEREKFIFDAFVDLKPVERFENRVIYVELGVLTTARAREF